MTDPAPHRRRAPGMSPDQRRAMIVRAALPLLATHGAAVTTAQVARAAGIGEATVFRAFPDKDALLDACVAEALHPGAALADLAAIPLTQPLGDRLTAAATALRAHLDRIGAVLAAAHAAGRPGRGQRDVPPVRDRASGREESVDAVRAAVAALFAPEGDRLRLPADQLAVLFLAVLVPSRTPLAGAAPTPAELVDLFLHGALAPAGPEENR
ncbi:TetR/AcrR family transcriptional regulator [Micromonospora sp. DR5-3]|uniref:TetR/AcrR family transcriptional regulator n=1 Tax=unclassified Micromonospora TaxID=2617518 RepID=UPI001CA30762|nr:MULTISPECIES: helix-turn-helix domain-containing protein [unclassified Micromonospora]MCW3818231.1 TetR/AcrR family transcriptional regulator [Micromonospora sp. DR5-3]